MWLQYVVYLYAYDNTKTKYTNWTNYKMKKKKIENIAYVH